MIACCFLVWAVPLLAGSIKGTVTDKDGEGLAGAVVQDLNAGTGTFTDGDGNFELKFEGSSTKILVSLLNYKKATLEVKDGEVVAISLEDDFLSLDAVVLTGSSNPKTKLESSVAITTVNSKEIENLAPTNTAVLLQAVPGFLVETSAGETGNNLFARGIPSAGAYEYVQFQEDGLPVFEDGALQFANIDNFHRIDATVSRMEAVKGGSSSILATGAPGGIINFISQTGQNEFKGTTKLTVGDYGLFRGDANLGGAFVKDKLFFNVGGFYRVDQGIRRTGYNANNGGQVKANMTYKFDKGQARVYYKHLNDRTTFYQSTPFVFNNGQVEGIDGFDPNFGTFSSNNLRLLRVPQGEGGVFEADLENGINPVVNAIGSEIKYYVSDKITVTNAFRNTSIDMDYNAIFAAQWMGDVSSQDDFATGVGIDPADAIFTYRDGGAPLEAGTMVKRADFWNIRKQMDNFANRFSANFYLNRVNLNAGIYTSNWKSSQHWNWSSYLVSVQDDPRLVNLENSATGEDFTYNGISGISWLQRQSQIQGRVNAIFADADIQANDRLNFNVGLRFDADRYRGGGDHGSFGNDIMVLDSNSADNGVNILQGDFTYWEYDINELSYTGAVNYKFSDKMAAFARYSHGFRAPIEESFYGPAIEDRQGTAGLADLEITTVDQAELGYKYTTSGFAIFANAFFMNLGNIAYQDIGAGGTAERRFANVQNIGLELEVIKQLGPVNLRFSGTLQDPRYRNYVGSEEALNGNLARRISQFYFLFRPEVSITDDLMAYVGYTYFGRKYQDIANTFELPGFGNATAGISYRFEQVRLAVDGTNLLNTIGLTEADGLQSGAFPADGQIFMGRSILGRAVRASITLDF